MEVEAEGATDAQSNISTAGSVEPEQPQRGEGTEDNNIIEDSVAERVEPTADQPSQPTTEVGVDAVEKSTSCEGSSDVQRKEGEQDCETDKQRNIGLLEGENRRLAVDEEPEMSLDFPQHDETSNDSTTLHIVLPTSEKKRKRSRSFDIEKEIEQDIERELEKKSKKTSLTVKKVKSILRYVIGNESVLAMVSNSMRDAGEDMELEPKLTRSKTRKLREENNLNHLLWPLSPIQAPQLPAAHNEHLVLIREELPEEEDDEEYRPTVEDLQDHSDDESGRHSVSLSSLDVSAVSRYVETFDPRLLDDSAQDSQGHNDVLTSTNQSAFSFKKPPESIGQRTRSKLSLSSTPLETIEQAFVPPDITTDMYDFQCDNLEWENFLKEFMQPLSNDTADADEDDDPEYKVAGEEEVLDREELRRDRAVTVSSAELRTLMIELLGDAAAESSDDEAKEAPDKPLTPPPPATPPSPTPPPRPATPPRPPTPPPPEPSVIGMTRSQQLLLMQQMRQHTQLLTQHFLQTHWHHLFSEVAVDCKVMLAQLVELGKQNSRSVVNVFNLHKALQLVEEWEEFLTTSQGAAVVKHMDQEMSLAQDAKQRKLLFRASFHPLWLGFVARSQVFMYPSLLPQQPFRSDFPARMEFAEAEDQLIALGLEQVVPHLEKYPRWCDKNQGKDRAAADLIHEVILRGRTTMQIVRRIRAMKKVKGNPINHYFETGSAPRTVHFVIPFAFPSVIAPRDQRPELLEGVWRDFVEDVSS